METSFINLQWLLSQQQLNLQLHCDSEQEIHVVQPTELLDPTPFLQPNALVLLVGLAFEHHPEHFSAYVANLAQHRVSAIGFGTGLVFEQVPEALIQAAQREGIGLFEVPRDTPFVSISSLIAREFRHRATSQQRALYASQTALQHAAMQEGLQGVMLKLAQSLNLAAVLRDSDQRILAQADPRGVRSSDTALRMVQHRLTPIGDRAIELATYRETALNSFDRAMIKQACRLCDLLLQRPEQLRAARSMLNELALKVLLGQTTDPSSLDAIFNRIADGSGRVRPVLIHSNDPQQIAKALSTVDQELRLVERELCTVSFGEDAALVLFRGNRSAKNILTLFREHTQKLRIGIDVEQPWAEITKESLYHLLTSVRALKLGEHFSAQTNRMLWTQDPAVRAALDFRAQETIERLKVYDQQNRTELYRTLAVYLQQGNSIARAAEVLGIHRHTVRTRVGLAAQVCEADLSDPVSCAELLLLVISRQEH
ncbi:PucR family transcriptional regulator [Corynebacterium pseudopelargi]|uniref:Purine catabolism regulatory protein n=1 Tax=Corynebacterium pseudopelargi TaxID=2080757 RepID=A0A3G6IWR4_9CORY|nr:PucR family transcriptional regulator [Corynebacterium pseudopelargi]AZA10003.1 Purine catabolism regulatory protein [Corynebacterium pseudopelargi]